MVAIYEKHKVVWTNKLCIRMTRLPASSLWKQVPSRYTRISGSSHIPIRM